jgi:hypothetical protein
MSLNVDAVAWNEEGKVDSDGQLLMLGRQGMEKAKKKAVTGASQ